MKYFILVVILLLSSAGWSQNMNFVFRGKVENVDLAKKEGGVTVSIIQNGTSVTSTQTASSGKYALNAVLLFKTPFEIVFSKPGLVSKRVLFDFSKMNEEDSPAAAEFDPVESLDMTMFKDRPGVDFSFLNTEPVAKFGWNERDMGAKPDMTVVNKMRNKIEDLLNQGEKNEAQYQAAILAGQGFYDAKEYEKALAKFEEATGLKPEEKLPPAKIVELDALIKAQKQLALGAAQADAEYNNLIAAADNLRDAGELEKAVAKYKEAIAKKPEQYPKDEVTKLTARIAAAKVEKENQVAYDAKIKQADAFLKQNSLRAAKDAYTEALALKPSEVYPKDKLKEIETKLSAATAKEELKKKYDAAIEAADKLYAADNFAPAKAKYEEALAIESASIYAKERIKLCDTGLAAANAEAEKATKIADLLKKGNTDLTANKLPEAKTSFSQVLTLDPTNQQAIEKLAIIEQKAQEASDLAATEKKYADLVKLGDVAKTAKKFEEALAKYQEAQTVKTTPEIQAKIAEVQLEINKAKSLADAKAAYADLMAEGASKMAANDLDGAKADYTAASKLDPTQALPKQKITEIDKLLLAQAGQAEKEANFNKLVSEGANLFAAGDLEKSKAKYVEAGKLDPAKEEPKARIREIDALIAENLAKAGQAANYKKAVDEGDKLFNLAKWDEAKAKYREAMTFDAANPYPGRKVTEIDQKIQERDAGIAKQKEIETLLKDGTRLQGQNKLEDARDKFQAVIDLDPSNAVAAANIKTINDDLAKLKNESQKEEAFKLLKEEGFALAAAKSYPEAKKKLLEALSLKTDPTVQAKIDEINTQLNNDQAQLLLDKKYNDFISQASTKENAGDLNGAIASYQEASKVKPAETLPKEKVNELKAQLANDSASKLELDRQYNEAMKRGDQLMVEKEYLQAIGAFNEALAIKPDEKEPVRKAALAEEEERKRGGEQAQYEKILTVAQTKIDEGDLVKAEELVIRAKGLKPADPRPVELLKRIKELRLAETEYASNMSKAETKASAKSYEDAIALFELAKKAKPSETLPDERIAAMNQFILDQSSAAKKDELYNDYMRKGNATETGKRYEEALSHYQNALSVKPADQPAKDKINEIQQILDDLAHKNDDDLEKKNKFDALIKEADALFAAKVYVHESAPNAKDKYQDAMAIFPENAYAKAQRDEAVRLARLEGEAAGNEAYDKLLKVADEKFTLADYDKAKELYERAVAIKNKDPYPKKKLAEIDAILNPIVVASAKLEDLGEPFDGSIMDGGFVLEKAKNDRIALKKTRIENKATQIYASEEEMTRAKVAERLQTRNEIVLMLSKISEETVDADDNRLALIERLKIADTERDVIDRENGEFEFAENRATRGTLEQVAREVANDQMVDDNIHMVNAAKMDLYQTYQSDEIDARNAVSTRHSYDADKQIADYKVSEIGETAGDYEDRLEIERKVDNAEDYTYLKTQDLGAERYATVQVQKNQVDNTIASYQTKAEEASKVSGDNNDQLIDVQRTGIAYNSALANTNEENAFKIDGEIAAVERKAMSDNAGLDKVRKDATVRIKGIQVDVAESQRLAYNSETEKYLANQVVLNSETSKRDDINIVAGDAMDSKIAYVERMENKGYEANSQAQLSDEDQRLKLLREVDVVELSIDKRTLENTESREMNTSVLVDLKKTNDAKVDAEENAQHRAAQDVQSTLDKINNDPQKKVKVQNALGNEYPEGVSEESFQNKDQDGLVKTIITRRVVVINGHADVYVRTQSLNGITYSKNGSPSLSNVWNSETQDPKLVRHF